MTAPTRGGRPDAAARQAAWSATPHHLAVVGVGVALAVAAVLGHRTDLLVVAIPLLVVAVLGALGRPERPSLLRTGVRSDRLPEGSTTTVTVDVAHDPRAEALGVDLAPSDRLRPEVPHGATSTLLDGDQHHGEQLVSPEVWGRHSVGRGEVRLSSAWAAHSSRFRAGEGHPLLALPSPQRLPLRSDRLRPAQQLGRHLSRRAGEGSEFAEIRAFRPGDRIRRIHWPTSARTGSLHVRTMYAEQDAQVMLLVDVLSDIPHADPGAPSSVEAAVQAAAHVAGHFTTAGDRVGLRVLGDAGVLPVPAGTGRRHLQRLLGALATVDPASDRQPDVQQLSLGLAPGSLLLALTPLTSRVVVDAVVALSRRGLDVACIDVTPAATVVDEDVETIAWRLLTLERRRTADLLEQEGIPVVAWQDASSVEELLRRLQARHERARA
ncbi:DUF58 domain-containing protein [Arsenicicoccus bolidensis]|uniref:DUF58 domain-containing protein n=1 Tax=Arsenicicoccus bolidensis TaxID=229480 RepID=UPI0028B1E9C7|nr:DUF58 domain-containing protein [Arsenicicoccus bolidensis]